MTARKEPARPLGPEGLKVWRRFHLADPERALRLGELVDERLVLRSIVLREGDPQDRVALRRLDSLIDDTQAALERAAAWRKYARRK